MKALIIVALFVTCCIAQTVDPIPTCLYCKNMDMVSGPLYTFGFCPPTKQCFEDIWNRQNAWCPQSWRNGYSLDLNDDCKASVGVC